jgi:hypothetical protein
LPLVVEFANPTTAVSSTRAGVAPRRLLERTLRRPPAARRADRGRQRPTETAICFILDGAALLARSRPAGEPSGSARGATCPGWPTVQRVRDRAEVVVRRWFVRLVAGTVVALVAFAMLFLVGMRTKTPAVIDRVRRFNRAVTNPRVLRSAGSPGASASVIRHVGRVSGRSYETPVGPFALGDDFVIALPYGPGADWVRNVVTAGSATLIHDGRTVPVHQPEIVPTAEVICDLPRSEQRTLWVFDVDQCLRVRPVLDS